MAGNKNLHAAAAAKKDGLLEEEFINDDPNGVHHTIEIVRELENADRIDIDLTEDNIYTAVL